MMASKIKLSNRCISAVIDKVGSEAKVDEAFLAKVSDRIYNERLMMARRQPDAYRMMTEAQQVEQAARNAIDSMKEDAALKARRTRLDIVAQSKKAREFAELLPQRKTGSHALYSMLKRTHELQRGRERDWQRTIKEITDTIPDKYFGFVQDRKSAYDVVREILGEATGNSNAAHVAKKWVELTEQMRTVANSLGANIGKLDYGYIPQSHSEVKVYKAGQDKWVSFVKDKLDRSKYTDETGRMLDDAELEDMLGSVFHTITTGGIDKIKALSRRGGKLQDKHSAHRALHFKDAESTIAYSEAFGKGSLIDAMAGHVAVMARDTALLEEWGPNARSNYDRLKLAALRKDGGKEKRVGVGVGTDEVWDTITGANHPYNIRAAEINSAIRTWQSTTALGGAVLSSLTDIPLLFGKAHSNGIGFVPMLRELVAQDKKSAELLGFMAESMLNKTSRWVEGGEAENIVQKMADFTFRASLLNKWTDRLKESYAIMASARLGEFTRKPWAGLKDSDRIFLERKGVNQELWDIWHKAAPVKAGRHNSLLNVDAIMDIPDLDGQTKLNAAHRLMGFIMEESDTAVTSADLISRARIGKFQKGSLQGEMARHLLQFKTFPMALVGRQMDMLSDLSAAKGKAYAGAYAGGLMLSMIGFGALAMQAKSLAAGKDPEDMTTADFWKKAFFQSGALGIYGDIINTGLGGESRTGAPNWMNLLGPTVGDVADFGALTFGNAGQWYNEQETNIGAEFARFASNNIPAIKLWYTRAAIDRLVFHQLQEYFNPGYLDAKRARDEARTGQQYYWELGEPLPDRMPNFAAAIGE